MEELNNSIKRITLEKNLAIFEKNLQSLEIIRKDLTNFLYLYDGQSTLNSQINLVKELLISVVTHCVLFDNYNNTEQSISNIKNCLSHTSLSGLLYYNLGSIYKKIGNTQESIKYYKISEFIDKVSAPKLIETINSIKEKNTIRILTKTFNSLIEKKEYAIANKNIKNLIQISVQLKKFIYNYESFSSFLEIVNHIKFEYFSCVSHAVMFDDYKNIEDDLKLLSESLIICPSNAMVHYNIAHLNRRLGRIDVAIAHYKLNIFLDQNHEDAFLELGLIYKDQNRSELSLKTFQKGLELHKSAKIMNEIGVLYALMNRKDESNKYLDECIKNTSDPVLMAIVYVNKGYIESGKGNIAASLDLYTKSYTLDSKNCLAIQNKLLNMNYTFKSPQDMFFEHINLGKKLQLNHSVKLKKNISQKNKKTRIGYISGDFFGHAVSYFSAVLLNKYNKDLYEIYCYSNTEFRSESTSQYDSDIKWMCIKQFDTYNACKRILEDNLDFMIDLSGHTAGNRIDLFCNRLCKNQITFLGYPNTTGISTIDFRLVDNTTDTSKSLATEKLLKFDKCFLCYTPKFSVKIPDLKTFGVITFGSFNKSNKFNSKLLNVWDKILTQTGDCKLLIKGSFYSDNDNEFLEKFSDKNKSKINIVKKTKTHDEHIAMYSQIDISLDTFPYSGTTTTCESLLSGVPVITLYSDSNHCHAVSSSILTNCGLQDFVANTEDRYIKIAVRWANQRLLLTELKSNLRQKFLDSDVCNQNQYIKNYESILHSLTRF